MAEMTVRNAEGALREALGAAIGIFVAERNGRR